MNDGRMTRGVAHLVRAGILGVAALTLALGGHVAAGGSAPGPLGLAVLTALTSAFVLVLTLRRLGALALVGWLGLLQAGLHAGLTLATAPGTATVVGTAPTGFGHHHHVALSVTGGVTSPHDLAMTLAHAAATLLTALLLARAEHLAWLAASVVAPLLPSARTLLAHLAGLVAPPLAPAAAPMRLATQHRTTVAPRRGPPAVA